ncbi:MAG: NAD(P)-dependent alcohol dehydrogenase [Proteobacteria bacterium]|nr:NAD(P)-dependent alcohol dehydrogenase [Pseudomonadota bacterium]
MKVWEIQEQYGIDGMRVAERAEPTPGPGQIVVAMKAASLNYRDLITVMGMAGQFPLPLVPFSDGAGEVVSVGAGVTRVKAGDKVCPLFFQTWLSGPVTAEARFQPLGGPLDGVLQQKMLLSAEGVSKYPAHLSYEEAATLPCAGLTAWRAVAIEAPVGPGDTVLVQGTGGVSIFALQFAKARGAKVIATSSSDEKLARAKALGADYLINYKTTPDWGAKARELTGGKGVDLVVEVGGENTMGQSIDAARVGGSIVVIGVLGGYSSPMIIPILFGKNLHIHGISVGSREQFDDMAANIDKWKLKPVVDQVFPFGELPAALRLMQAGGHFGKIVVGI